MSDFVEEAGLGSLHLLVVHIMHLFWFFGIFFFPIFYAQNCALGALKVFILKVHKKIAFAHG